MDTQRVFCCEHATFACEEDEKSGFTSNLTNAGINIAGTVLALRAVLRIFHQHMKGCMMKKNLVVLAALVASGAAVA